MSCLTAPTQPLDCRSDGSCVEKNAAGQPKELVCIRCPLGCTLQGQLAEGEWHVEGNRCPRGEAYFIKEATSPSRTVTGLGRVAGGQLPVVSVKTVPEVPKDRVMDVARGLAALEALAPVSIGQVLEDDFLGTGASLIATKSVGKKA